MSWVILYPGDWHMLMNYQSALMKAYYDAGLKGLAKAAGYLLRVVANSRGAIPSSWEARPSNVEMLHES